MKIQNCRAGKLAEALPEVNDVSKNSSLECPIRAAGNRLEPG
jgi:hypothetical protein